MPHGAKGIQGMGFAVAFGDDKIVFTLNPRLDDDPDREATEKHYTVQAGQNPNSSATGDQDTCEIGG